MMLVSDKPCYIFNPQCIHAHGVGDDGMCAAEEPDYRTVLTDANLRRRMGKLLKMASYCGLKTLEGIEPEKVCGIITATGMGFMKDTISMADNMIDRHEDMLNPMPFMQSTFNTASGYIALMRGIRAYNTTYVHREGGFPAALDDALLLLAENPCSGVLVGAFDEATPAVDCLRKRLGEYTDDGRSLPLGEGAAFMYLSDVPNIGSCQAVAQLLGYISAEERVSLPEDTAFCREDFRVVRCSSLAGETGAFMTVLPVVVSMILQEHDFDGSFLSVVDDVNPHGSTIFIRIMK